MDADKKGGLRPDRPLVIRNPCDVGRADFAQGRAANRHDLGDPETPADFDQLAARHHDFAPGGQSPQRQQRG